MNMIDSHFPFGQLSRLDFQLNQSEVPFCFSGLRLESGRLWIFGLKSHASSQLLKLSINKYVR